MNLNFDFEKIKKGISDAAKKTKETSGNVVEIAKLKYKLYEVKSEIESNYAKIGKIVYSADENEDISEEVGKICSEISSLSEKQSDMQDLVNSLTNKKLCPHCGAKFDKDFEYCPKCGKKYE